MLPEDCNIVDGVLQPPLLIACSAQVRCRAIMHSCVQQAVNWRGAGKFCAPLSHYLQY